MGKMVNIVVDASGSMAEDDKNAVVKYLLIGISHAVELELLCDIEFSLYQWGRTSKKLANLENAKIEFSGKASKSELSTLRPLIDENQPLIFISDGNFNSEEKNSIKTLSHFIVPIFVGVDADRASLQNISTEGIVYSVPDFMQALFDACR